MRENNRKKRVLLLCLAIMIAVTMVLAGCASDKATGDVSQKDQLQQLQPSDEEGVQTVPTKQGLVLESVEQDEDRMVVTTSYCRLHFPFAFSDVIQVCVVDQTQQETLLFSAYLEKTEYPMFSIIFDSAEGIPVGTLTLEDGTILSVTAHIFPADESLEPGMLQTFYAAQESVNDVISSLTDAKGFVPAQ